MGEGFWDLGHGFASGVSGVVREPVRGARKDGAIGFVGGIAKGIFGVVKKPVSGMHDFGSKSLKAVAPHNRAKDDQTHRRRLPRYFGNSRILEPYNLDMAYGQFVLVVISGAAYADEDCMHNVIVDDKLYLITDFRVMCLNLDDFSIRWQITQREIVMIVQDFPRILLDEGNPKAVCGAHKCEFLVQDCKCNISAEAKTGKRFLIESTEREFPALYASLFKTWSFWHRTATPPQVQYDVEKNSSQNLVHQNFIKRELQFFGAMDVEYKIHRVEAHKFDTQVEAGDKQETSIRKSDHSNSQVYSSNQA